MAVIINNKITPGPPLYAAEPMVVNIPPPITAATPISVKSLTESTRLSD